MAVFSSDLVAKNIRHRGLYSGKEQTVSGRYRVAVGSSIALTDRIRMVPLGENVRPIRITVLLKSVGAAQSVPTNPTFSVGIDPYQATSVTRADGTTYAPVTLSAVRLGAATALTTDEMATFTEIDTVADIPNWGPFFVTLTPAGAGAFSVATADADLICEVVYLGEQSTATPVYSEFNASKYKN